MRKGGGQARRRAWRKAGVCGLAPVYGRNVGRAISPAAGGLRHRRGFRDDASIVPYGCGARACRALQDTSASKRQCTPPSAPYGAATSPCRGGFGGMPPERLPCKGSCRRQPTEGCCALPCQYPFGPPQPPPAGVNARPTMQGKRVAEPGTAGGVPASGGGSRADRPPPLCIGPLAGLADGWRWRAGTCLWPQCRAGVLARRCTPTGPPTKKHRGAALRRPGAKSGKKEKGGQSLV